MCELNSYVSYVDNLCIIHLYNIPLYIVYFLLST